MAVEPRRGCGYRKVGGLYLVCKGSGMPCDRLPIPLTVCPTCSAGFKQTRGWTWINVVGLTGGVHRNCADQFPCPLCMATSDMGRAGLLWIGERFYATPAAFTYEADQLGISRRVKAVPRGFELGKTWVLLAHPKAITLADVEGDDALHYAPGIFRVFKPTAVEKLITGSQSRDATVTAELQKQGITPVVVPDGDRDHQGTVYDKFEEQELFT